MALDVLPTIMTTLVVQISDKGTYASERVLDGYYAVHRLLLAIVSEYNLQGKVERQLRTFMKSAGARVKEAKPK